MNLSCRIDNRTDAVHTRAMTTNQLAAVGTPVRILSANSGRRTGRGTLVAIMHAGIVVIQKDNGKRIAINAELVEAA